MKDEKSSVHSEVSALGVLEKEFGHQRPQIQSQNSPEEIPIPVGGGRFEVFKSKVTFSIRNSKSEPGPHLRDLRLWRAFGSKICFWQGISTASSVDSLLAENE